MSFFSRIFGGGRGGQSQGGGGGGNGSFNPGNFNPGPNPANAAMPYLNQVPALGRQYYEPYINEAQQASGIANPIYNQMAQNPNAYIGSLGQQQNPVYGEPTQNPTDFLNLIMRNYTPSEGYRFKERELTRAAQNSAAQGGFSGTRNAQLEQADIVRGLLGDDSQQFLQNVLNIRGLQGGERQQHLQNASGVQGRGLQGQENRLLRGYESSGNLADFLGSALGTQGSLAFQGQAQQNGNAVDQYNAAQQQQNYNAENRQKRRSSFFNLLGRGIGTGVGAYFGGPTGAAVGSRIFGG